jgi:hypothetical protein
LNGAGFSHRPDGFGGFHENGGPQGRCCSSGRKSHSKGRVGLIVRKLSDEHAIELSKGEEELSQFSSEGFGRSSDDIGTFLGSFDQRLEGCVLEGCLAELAGHSTALP